MIGTILLHSDGTLEWSGKKEEEKEEEEKEEEEEEEEIICQQIKSRVHVKYGIT